MYCAFDFYRALKLQILRKEPLPVPLADSIEEFVSRQLL